MGAGVTAAYCEHPSAGACDCAITDAPANTEPCNPPLVGAPALCCAGDTWPEPGSTCTCQGAFVYSCLEVGDGECACGGASALAEPGTSSTCGGSVCCASGLGKAGDLLCVCNPTGTESCEDQSADAMTVPSCDAKDVTAMLCPIGSHLVDECR